MGVLIRTDGWESRLAVVIAAAQGRPYVLGEHDCLRFACACIVALTGVDFWPRFAGYHTRREALRTILQIAPTLGEAVSVILQRESIQAAFAWRGDVMLYRDLQAEDHLAVCNGASGIVLAPNGLWQVPLTDSGLLCAWRIG